MFRTKYLFLLTLSFVFISCSTGSKLTSTVGVKNNAPDSLNRKLVYYFYEGLKQKEDKQFDRALETFLLCQSIDSTDADVQSQLSILYSVSGLNTQALQHMENAVRLQPQNWWYSMQLISYYSQLNQTDKAIYTATQTEKFYPRKPEIYYAEAALYKQARQYQNAIDAYSKLEALTGIDQNISLEKFSLYMQLGKTKAGFAEIDRLINKYPTEYRYKVLLGDILMKQNEPQKAFDLYQEVLKNDPENPYVYISLSEYYKSKNEPQKSLEAIVSALKNDRLDVDTKMNILGQYVGKFVKDTTMLDETESLFKLLVDRYPLEEKVHSYYAEFLTLRNRLPEAVSELETMLSINPKNDQTWLRLIQIALSQQNFDKILDITQKAITELPKNPLFYFYRGIAQFQKQQYNEALQTYRTGLPYLSATQNSLKSDFYSQIADVYYKLQQKDSAFINYDRSLIANPQNTMVMNNYAYYLSLEKSDLKKAERMSAKTVEQEPKNSTYLDTYAWILYQEGNYTLAKFYIDRAIDNLTNETDPGVIYEHCGDILWMSGNNDTKALEMWQKAYDSGNKSEELKLKIQHKGWQR